MQSRQHRGAESDVPNERTLRSRRTRLTHCIDHRSTVLSERFLREREFSDRNGHIAVTIELKFNTAGFNLLHRFSRIFGDGAGLWIWHKASWAKYFTEFTNFRHGSGGSDGDIEVLKTLTAFIDHVLETDELGAGLPGGISGLTLSENQNPDILTASIRKRTGPTHHLIGLTRINSESKRKRDCLIEFRGRKGFQDLDRLIESIIPFQIHLLNSGPIAFATCF